MKTQNTLLVLAILITSLSFGQNIFPASGNVGIGTTTPSVPAQIEKGAPGVVDVLRIRNNYSSTSALHGTSILLDGYYSQSKISSYENPQYTLGGNLQLQTYNGSGILNNGILLDRLGNVGIGTTSPTAKLEVAGDAKINGTLNVSGANALYFSNYGGGLYMLDDSWIRTYGNKNFYHNTGIMRTDGIFHVGPNGDRFVVNSNGNVGIGTTTPNDKLEVAGSITLGSASVNANTTKLFLKNPSGKTWALSSGANMINENHFSIYNWTDSAATPFFSILDNGNIGIGDSVPLSKLSLKEGGQHLNFITNKKLAGTWPPTSEATTMTIQSSGNSAGNLAFATGNSEAMRIIPNGNVGIGTTTPDQKLTVNGIIHAKEIIVDTAITPDYVFQKYYTGKSNLKSDYVMPTLAEIESFTKKNHHLPNVPSAQEVQQNGVSLGEMSNVLLQKVEELTLYAIEQNKVIEELKAQVTALMAKKQ